MTAAPSDPIHTSKQIYSDWLNQVGDKNETEVFDKLPQQRKDVVRTAVSILSNYQKGVTESQILPEEISILGRSKSPAGETTLPDEALFARVNQSFQTIHPLGKAEDILRAKYIPSSNLKEQVEELKEGSLEKFQAMTEAIPRIVEKQGKIGERILSMREDYILAPLREWTAALPNPRDKAIAEKAILRLEEKLLPAHYGVTKANIEEGFSLFETEYHLARSQSLKTDVKTIQTTGLAARSSAPTTASGVQDLENALTRLQEQRANLLTDLHKGLTEGFTGSEEGEFASYLNEYRQEADALINRALGLERELEPHLANPEMAARYCFVCSTHAKLIQQHQNLALAMEEIPKNSVDFARRYNRSYNSSLSILGSLWKATKTTSVPEAIVQNESVARGLIEKTIIWGEFAKDNGSGKAALELARYYSSYAPINGEGESFMQQAIKNVDIAIKMKVPGALEEKGRILQGRFYDLRGAGAPPEEVNRYLELAVQVSQKIGSLALIHLFENGVLEAGDLLLATLQKEMSGGKFTLEQVKYLATAALANVEGAEELLARLSDKFPKNLDLQMAFQLLKTGLSSEYQETGSSFDHATAVESLQRAARALSEADLQHPELNLMNTSRFAEAPVRILGRRMREGAELEAVGGTGPEEMLGRSRSLRSLPGVEASVSRVVPASNQLPTVEARARFSWIKLPNFTAIRDLLASFIPNIFKKKEAQVELLGPEEIEIIENGNFFKDNSGDLVGDIIRNQKDEEKLSRAVTLFFATQIPPEGDVQPEVQAKIEALGNALKPIETVSNQLVEQVAKSLFSETDDQAEWALILQATRILLDNRALFEIERPPMEDIHPF